jgi:hypothetical protein
MPITQDETDRQRKRGQWTIKDPTLDDELVNGCRIAAKRRDLSLGRWAADALRRAYLFDLGKLDSPFPASPDNLPARQDDVADRLSDKLQAIAD